MFLYNSYWLCDLLSSQRVYLSACVCSACTHCTSATGDFIVWLRFVLFLLLPFLVLLPLIVFLLLFLILMVLLLLFLLVVFLFLLLPFLSSWNRLPRLRNISVASIVFILAIIPQLFPLSDDITSFYLWLFSSRYLTSVCCSRGFRSRPPGHATTSDINWRHSKRAERLIIFTNSCVVRVFLKPVLYTLNGRFFL